MRKYLKEYFYIQFIEGDEINEAANNELRQKHNITVSMRPTDYLKKVIKECRKKEKNIF